MKVYPFFLNKRAACGIIIPHPTLQQNKSFTVQSTTTSFYLFFPNNNNNSKKQQ